MKRIHSLNDPLLAEHLRNLLESDGIACSVRNRNLRTAMGEVPLAECWLELWIEDEADTDRALELVRGGAAGSDDGAGWTCPDCSEAHEGQFDSCWRCGRPAPTD